MIIFIAMPFIGGWIGYQYHSEQVLTQQPVTPIVEIESQDRNKKSFYGGEIPISWSQYTNYEAAPLESTTFVANSAKFSFAENHVTVSDWNALQVDFYILTKEAADAFIVEAKEFETTDAGIEIKDDLIGGAAATTIKWPLDNGEITKAGSGGSDYLIKLVYQDSGEYLLMRKQAQGDEEFENAFSNFLDTVDFTKPHTALY